MLYCCRLLQSPLDADGCPEVMAVLMRVTHGWDWVACADGSNAPAIHCERSGDGYRLRSRWLQGPHVERTPVSAACSLLVDLVRQLTLERPELLYLHAGAVRLGDAAVVFPSTYRAGKSTLVSALAACGHQVVADDVMGLQLAGETMEGVAPGISPRLRLPLPASLPAALHEFAERYAGLEDDWYRYLDLPSGRLAAFGSTATVQAFVFLERGADSGASLHRVDRGRALQHLLHRNFARGAAAGWILERFAALVRCRECLVLRYRDVAEAAAILEAAFVTGHLERIVDEVEASLPAPGRVDASAGEAEYVASDLPLVQVPGVRLHTVGGEHFLAGRDGQAIFGLSGVGPAIWQCLAEPVTPEELAHGLADAFPDVSTARIEGDVMALLRALRARGLVRAATT